MEPGRRWGISKCYYYYSSVNKGPLAGICGPGDGDT